MSHDEKAVETKNVDTGRNAGNNDGTEFDLAEPQADAQVPAKSKSDSGDGATTEAEGETAEFSPNLLARAKELGISFVDAKSLGSPESLTKVCDELEARADRSPRGNDKPESRTEPPAKPERRKLTLDPAVIGEDTAAILRQLDEQHAAELEAMREENKSLRERIERNLEAAREERMSQYFDAQTDYQDIIGPDHPRNRGKVADKMEVLKAGYEAMKRKVPSERELFQEAFATEFGDKQAAVARRKLTQSLERREKSLTARPDQRNTPADPYQAAIQAVAEAQQRMRNEQPAEV